jgi:hypothetical protein
MAVGVASLGDGTVARTTVVAARQVGAMGRFR